MTFTAKYLKKSDGSHLPVLMKLLSMTEGPIMELGTGFFSTPFLHWMCNGTRRKLVSYESNPDFYEVAQNFVSDFHKVYLVEDWDKVDMTGHWNIVFVDHAPGIRRNVEMARAANIADYVVVHDTETRSDWHYQYSKSFPLYKYRYDYKEAFPETSVLSNFIDLKDFKV